jgi:probable HAF family extracellular repeat protein
MFAAEAGLDSSRRMRPCARAFKGRVAMSAFRGFSAVFFAAAAALPASAATLVPVPSVPNSSLTTVFAINDSNTIAGSYVGTNDGIEHGFFGPLGSYTSFDAGPGGSEARGINNGGVITGFSNSQEGNTATEPAFERMADGTIVNIMMAGQQLYGQPQGINGLGKFAGTRWDFGSHEAVAFLGRDGVWLRDVRIPHVHQASTAQGISGSGVVVGSYFQPPTHGFIGSGNHLVTVDYPSGDNQGTTMEGINHKGRVVGQWTDSSGNTHSFLFAPSTGIFTDILVSGSSNVYAWAINAQGAVAVSTDIGSYIWCKKKSQCPSGGTDIAAPVHVMKR